jgi:hypothetical protein
LLRVWEEVDRVKEEMRREGVLPGEDEVKSLFPPEQYSADKVGRT